MAGVGDSKPNFEPSGETGPMKGIMARFWYSCAVFCAAALLLPLLTRTMVDDGSNGDIDLDLDADAGWSSGPSQSVQLGVTFFAIAVMLWTFIAAWFCYNSPFFPSEESIRRAKGPDEVANLDVSRSVLQRVAQGFADFIVENSRREDRTVGCNGEATTSLRGLDLAKFEELVAVAPAAAASALYGYKGTTPKKMFTKEFTPCSLSKECSCKGEIRGATPVDGKGSKEGTTIPQLDAPHLSLFKELLRDRLVANLMSEGGQKLSENGSEGMNWLGKSNLRSPSRWFAQSEPKGGDDTLDHLLRELLRSSGEVTVEEFPESRKEEMPFAASMADHARAIGDKCFKQQQFGAAVHCYEVATLLCPSGPSSPFREQLASGHCNCALACLELRRYGDAISECHAALVLVPSMHLTVKTLHRLAAAHICLKNLWEAAKCLRNCLDLEPDSIQAQRLLEAVDSAQNDEQIEDRCELVWTDLCIQGGRDKARKGRRGKKKSGPQGERDEGLRHLDRDAGLWHSMVAQNSKLYVFGGLPSRDADGSEALGALAQGPMLESSGGSEEFHVLDLETLELGSGSKVPQASYCHTATVVDNSMLVFGGSVDGLLVYDFVQSKWHSQPCGQGKSPRRRSCHSATALGRQLCIFGGIELMEQGNGRVCNDAYILELESWSWKKLDCTGIIPPARFGHTATQLLTSDGQPTQQLLIVGGRDQMTSCRDLVRDHSGLHILNVADRSWSEQAFSGIPPEKVMGHFACIWNPRTLLLLSGEAEASAGVELFLLDLEKWSWSQPQVQGSPPCARLGMAAAGTATGTGVDARVYVFGGVVLRGDQVMVDKTVYMLETMEAKEAKAEAAAARELEEAGTVLRDEELENDAEQDMVACPHLVPEKGEAPTDLPDDGDPNEEVEDEPELSFEELLEQEKAFFKLQSKKTSFPRSQAEVRRKDNRQSKKSAPKS